MAQSFLTVILLTAMASYGCHGRSLPANPRPHVRTAASIGSNDVTSPTVVYDAGDPNSVQLAGPEVTISATPGFSGRSRTNQRYPVGTSFSAQMKCAAGDTTGLVTSLYLSSLEGSKTQDEIDFEWLGNAKTSVQLNYYVNGVGGHEKIVQLGFDCSVDFHTYTIYYGADKLTVDSWLVDGVEVYEVVSMAGQPYPAQPVYFYESIWDASSINGGSWAGIAKWTSSPYLVKYQGFSVLRRQV